MKEKRCPKCDETKSIDNFSKCNSRKDGLKTYCKSCASIDKKKYNKENKDKNKKYRDDNKEKYKEYSENYYQENKEKLKEKSKENYFNNKEEKLEYVKEYNKLNKDKIKLRRQKYRKNNKDIFSKKEKEYYLNNKDKRFEYQYNYKKENIDKVKEFQSNYRKNNKKKIYESKLKWMKNNPHIVSWRNLLRNTLTQLNSKKEGKTVELLGYSAIELKEHIEKLFTPGMTWENYGEWHIDHIKPVCSFDSNAHVSIVCSLSNLQPLWATSREIDGIVYVGNLNKNKFYLL
jgi:hypothetical protein